MDDQLFPEAYTTSDSRAREDGSAQNTGAFFPNAQHFVLSGGTFTSTTKIIQVVTKVSPDFRVIPMGDLDLRNEIRLGCKSGILHVRNEQGSVKRMYSARIHGSKSKMTVAMYRGYNAEEEWRQDVSRHSWLRHPNFVQLYGAATSDGLHATILHDELIMAQQMLQEFRDFPVWTVYCWGYLDEEFGDACDYFYVMSGEHLSSSQCTIWIRSSSGRLCVDLTTRDSGHIYLPNSSDTSFRSVKCLLEPHHTEPKIVALMSLSDYHKVCFRHLSLYHDFSISRDASVSLGAIVLHDLENPNEIATNPGVHFEDHGWWVSQVAKALVMENGWTRTICDCLVGHT
ncbi:hypothetical protein C8R44DRAFT_798511, partial [Mycena epipterygia]